MNAMRICVCVLYDPHVCVCVFLCVGSCAVCACIVCVYTVCVCVCMLRVYEDAGVQCVCVFMRACVCGRGERDNGRTPE
jgi:hypothetical protein